MTVAERRCSAAPLVSRQQEMQVCICLQPRGAERFSGRFKVRRPGDRAGCESEGLSAGPGRNVPTAVEQIGLMAFVLSLFASPSRIRLTHTDPFCASSAAGQQESESGRNRNNSGRSCLSFSFLCKHQAPSKRAYGRGTRHNTNSTPSTGLVSCLAVCPSSY